MVEDLLEQAGGGLAASHRLAAGLRRDREAAGYGKSELGHLREAEPLASEQRTAALAVFVEVVDVGHVRAPFSSARHRARSSAQSRSTVCWISPIRGARSGRRRCAKRFCPSSQRSIGCWT